MEFPERFSNLPEYAFPRLRSLLGDTPAGGSPVFMSLGEPKHRFPDFVTEILTQNLAGFNSYPNNNGTADLLNSIAGWLQRRFQVDVDADSQILALNGTREGLFNAVIALSPEQKNGHKPKILMPNPFYQVYAVGAVAAGADPVFVDARPENNFLPDYHALPAETLEQTSVLFLCSPANPQGAIATPHYWADLIKLAEKYDIRIFADECYSEIYRDQAPTSALRVAADMGADPERVVIFHSLSKRSNLPGLRSGFAAGGPKTIAAMRRLRAYAGAPIPTALQAVSAAVWDDEAHVIENRNLYQEKYRMADEVFGAVQGYSSPEGGFFLWLPVENGEQAAMSLWKHSGIRVLPGAYLSRDTKAGNPGEKYIRVAMVAPFDETQQGLLTIRDCLY
ncbi:aspartate aminotransferase [Amylibacter marinus]|uniref:Aspartate aminotransferase n=1 Tax=Amylibacter marinus TaxID=1475483 RepID=A0ABQ5VVV8_9RHOB|nr:aminotransferase class I/II-fold pyridoxal phosphate-dependent enzyme [Amylibacter marinus]GLQ35418.1 aspartate aminotransferase [Amylibacter marinus]